MIATFIKFLTSFRKRRVNDDKQ